MATKIFKTRQEALDVLSNEFPGNLVITGNGKIYHSVFPIPGSEPFSDDVGFFTKIDEGWKAEYTPVVWETILTDVKADVCTKVCKAIEGYWGVGTLAVYKRGAQNPNIVINAAGLSKRKIERITHFTIGAISGIIQERGF